MHIIIQMSKIQTMKVTPFLKKSFDCRGWLVSVVSREAGLPYTTLWQHYTGRRKITAEQAMKYERVLGIPRSELRPDIWPPTEAAPTTRSGGTAGNG